MRAVSLVVVPVVLGAFGVFVGGVAGCDLFGIRCDADSDCPPEQEFCNLGLCSTVDGPVRAEGEGEEGEEGEGEAATCANDGDCDSVCYDATSDDAFFDADNANTCVPLDSDVVDCAEASGLGIDRRDDFVIYAGSAVLNPSASCTSGLRAYKYELRFVSRTQTLGGGFVEARVRSATVEGNGGGPFSAQVRSTNGTSGEIIVDDFSCYPDTDPTIALAVGLSSPASNALCLDVSGLDALP